MIVKTGKIFHAGLMLHRLLDDKINGAVLTNLTAKNAVLLSARLSFWRQYGLVATINPRQGRGGLAFRAWMRFAVLAGRAGPVCVDEAAEQKNGVFYFNVWRLRLYE